MYNNYEQCIGIVGTIAAGDETDVTEYEEEEALAKAEDAMALVLSLHNAFLNQGVTMPSEPDVAVLENLFDAYVCELAASVMCLQNYSDAPERLRKVADELVENNKKGLCNVDAQAIVAYRKLADRIEASKKAVDELMEKQSKEKADNVKKILDID